METTTKHVGTRDRARELFLRRHARYEVSPYFVLLDVRTIDVPPTHRRVHAGFDVDVYGQGDGHGAALSFENGEPEGALKDLWAGCHVAVEQVGNKYSRIEIIPDNGALVLNLKSHLEPEAQVRIRITHSRGLEQPAGAIEEKALAEVVASLESLGVKKSQFRGA